MSVAWHRTFCVVALMPNSFFPPLFFLQTTTSQQSCRLKMITFRVIFALRGPLPGGPAACHISITSLLWGSILFQRLTEATTSVLWHSVDFHFLHPSTKWRLCFIEEWSNTAAHTARGVSDSRSWGLQQNKNPRLLIKSEYGLPNATKHVHLRVSANYCCIPVIHPLCIIMSYIYLEKMHNSLLE